MTGGMVAVQAFYMISGFYMALILNEKYTGKGSWRLFMGNRLLRLFPVYWVMLLLVLLISLISVWCGGSPYFLWAWLSSYENLHWTTVLVFVLANVFLLGSDWLFFAGVRKSDGLLEASICAHDYKPATYNYLLIPQAWSVGAELMFYLLAPLLVRRRWWLQGLIVAASLGLRYFLVTNQFKYWDPWNYRFFPTEIALFLLGSLAYQLYRWLRTITLPAWTGWGACLLMILLIIGYDSLPIFTGGYRAIFFYSLFFCLIPVIFSWSKEMRLDRYLGELSYPIYIGHLLVVMLLRKWYMGTELTPWYGILSCMLSLVLAWLLLLFIIKPVERIRSKRAQRLLHE